jgi:hypothetical protein
MPLLSSSPSQAAALVSSRLILDERDVQLDFLKLSFFCIDTAVLVNGVVVAVAVMS